MRIPFLDLKAGYDELRSDFDAAYHRVMDSGWFLLGQELEAFESEYAAYCGTKYCIGVANGLDALHLSLRAAGIGPGDEVLVPSHTYIATWLAVTLVGATPVPVEPCMETMNIDTSQLTAAITNRTRAIIPVHLYGQPVDMAPLMAIAEKHGLLVLEDTAQAQGARYYGKRVGGLGHLAAHSFYPGKNLGAFADAGAITTNDFQLADKLRVIRNYGSRIKYHNEMVGYNSRMEELQAAFLRVKLGHLDEWNQRRKRIASSYLNELRSFAPKSSYFQLPHVPDWADPVWHLFVIRHSDRNALQEHLKASGIGTLIHYPVPIHHSQAYQFFSSVQLPLAERLAATVLSLPIGPQMDEKNVYQVVHAIEEFDSNGSSAKS
ncbi:MAG: DegT/DnrJ/EryC1/StrS family aminotransferase [Pirellula sp.]|jgi:dTDP-4-amino-4,6-dideoxygalactose transaminase|nr:DegT/DnrJ/EryC1/StrS family aminotransferase [Pirellula sp.]